MNKENIEPKNKNSQSDIDAAGGYKMYFEKNFGHDIPEHRKNGFLDGCRYKDTEAPPKPPAISSNEGETVEVTNVQEGKPDIDALITKYACSEYTHVANEPQFDCEMVEFSRDDLLLLLKEYAGQSQHSYTEDKWISVEDRLPVEEQTVTTKTQGHIAKQIVFRGGKFYHVFNSQTSLESIDIEQKNVTHWSYGNPIAKSYSVAEVLAIIEQVRNQCAEFSAIGETFTQIVEKDFKQLLK